MQNTSNDPNYATLLAAGAPKSYRAWIYCGSDNGWVRYDQDMIVSATTRAAMFRDDISVGNCVTKELQLVLRGYENKPLIPRMAAISMMFRLDDGNVQSEWYRKGRYYIDTRYVDAAGRLVITAYDEMLKLETPYCTEGEQGEWPLHDYEVITEILRRSKFTADSSIDPESEDYLITNNYEVGYPGFGEGAMTIRQVLGYIGAMYGGNWVITDDNKLRLIVLGDIPAQTKKSYLINGYGDYITFGGYRINVG